MDNGQGVGIRLSNPMKRCRRKAGVSFHRVRRDSRFSGARGAAPCTERSDAGPRIADAVSGQGAAPQDARYMVVRLCVEVRPLFQRDFCRFRLCSVFPLFFRSFAGTLGKILRTFDHDCPEALLAVTAASAA